MSPRDQAISAGVSPDHPDLIHLNTGDYFSLANSGHPVLSQIGQLLLDISKQLLPVLLPVIISGLTGKPVTPPA